MRKYFIWLFVMVCLAGELKAGKVDTVTIKSDVMHRNFRCVVITPDNYKKGKQPLPVVYLLHGYGGNHSDWIKKVPAVQKLVNTYQCIVVCPDGSKGSWYLDSPIDSTKRYETYVAKEIPAYIDAHYRTRPESRYRAIAGLSMGGHGALYLAIRHPEMFGAAGSMSGGVDIRPFPKNWDMAQTLGSFEEHSENWNANTVINLVNQLKPGQLAMIIDCGIKDFFYEVNHNLHNKLMELGIDHDYTERPGAHTWEYWANSVQYQMLFFSRFFNGESK
jgi:S-formylglutathione hydrolase FrmB